MDGLDLGAGEIHLPGNGKRAAHSTVNLLEGDDIAAKVVEPLGVDALQNRSPCHEIAVVEDAVTLQLDGQRSFAELVGIEVPVPGKQVVDAAHQAAAANDVIAGRPID